MKMFWYSISCIPLFLFSYSSTDSFTTQAHDWALRVTDHTANPEILKDLLTLLQDSYIRSRMTLKVQYDYLALMEEVGKGWNHIISTRLDPSKDADFDGESFVQATDFSPHLELFQQTCALQKKYVETINRVVDDNSKKYTLIKGLISEIRDGARAVVAQSLIETIAAIEAELKKAQQALSDAAALWGNESHIKSPQRALTELLWYYVPSLMMKSFVQFDRGCTASSKCCLAAYLESQHANNLLWDAIEIPRARYYAAHYRELYQILAQWHSPSIVGLPTPEKLIARYV